MRNAMFLLVLTFAGLFALGWISGRDYGMQKSSIMEIMEAGNDQVSSWVEEHCGAGGI